MKELKQELETMRFHQELLLHSIRNRNAMFNLLVVEKNLSKKEVSEIEELCERLNKIYEIEKAEGYVNFQPLFKQLKNELTSKVLVEELIQACIVQGMYWSFMNELKKYIY